MQSAWRRKDDRQHVRGIFVEHDWPFYKEIEALLRRQIIRETDRDSVLDSRLEKL